MLEENHYYDEDGNKLGEDDDETSFEVRIIDQGLWASMEHDGEIDKDLVTKDDYDLATKSGISEEASLALIDHYNPTDLNLLSVEQIKANGIMAFSPNDASNIHLEVDIDKMFETKYIDNHENITNIFVHEDQHYSDYKEYGRLKYSKTHEAKLELNALDAQRNHPSYENISNALIRNINSNRIESIKELRKNPFGN